MRLLFLVSTVLTGCTTAGQADPPDGSPMQDATGSQLDFGLMTSTPSQTVLRGNNTNYVIMITRVGGFTEQVNLSIGGLPTGVTATFEPNLVSSSSILSVTT